LEWSIGLSKAVLTSVKRIMGLGFGAAARGLQGFRGPIFPFNHLATTTAKALAKSKALSRNRALASISLTNLSQMISPCAVLALLGLIYPRSITCWPEGLGEEVMRGRCFVKSGLSGWPIAVLAVIGVHQPWAALAFSLLLVTSRKNMHPETHQAEEEQEEGEDSDRQDKRKFGGHLHHYCHLPINSDSVQEAEVIFLCYNLC
jgi:hypothetical protein